MSERPPNRAYLSLGSNVGAEGNLPAAVRALSAFGLIEKVSRVWESAPVGFVDQPDFLNAAVLLATGLSAERLCAEAIPAIERVLGRVRDPLNKNAPRTIDVDLSLYNGDVLSAGRRTIPAHDVLTRAFVAVPLAELDPQYVHPVAGRMLASIAAELARSAALRLRTDVVLAPA